VLQCTGELRAATAALETSVKLLHAAERVQPSDFFERCAAAPPPPRPAPPPPAPAPRSPPSSYPPQSVVGQGSARLRSAGFRSTGGRYQRLGSLYRWRGEDEQAARAIDKATRRGPGSFCGVIS
jgi:hypothetical protein